MVYSTRHKIKQVTQVFCFSGAFGIAVLSVWAGETIQFSRGSKRIILPDSVHQQVDLEKYAPSQRNGGEVETPAYLDIPTGSFNSGTPIKNKKLQDYIDQRLNWIFVTPDSSSSLLTTEEAFGIRKTSFEDPNQKKKVVQKYMEGTLKEGNKEKKDETKRLADDEEDSLDKNKKNTLSESESTSSSNKNSDKITDKPTEKNFRSQTYGNSLSIKENDESVAGILPGNTMSDSSFTAILKGNSGIKDEKMASSANAWKPGQDFQQILRPPKINTSINGPSDPANLAGDNSRSSLQPVIGGSSTMDRFSTRTDNLNKFGSINHSSINGFDEYSGRVFGSSSLTPAMITPPTPIIQPKAPVLEIPKRKF